jgi:hypothetical protein
MWLEEVRDSRPLPLLGGRASIIGRLRRIPFEDHDLVIAARQRECGGKSGHACPQHNHLHPQPPLLDKTIPRSSD